MKKIVKTVSMHAILHLSSVDKESARRAVNLSVLGREKVNKVNKDGEIVSDITPEQEALIVDAHYRIEASHDVVVVCDITDEGTFVNFRVKERVK